MKCQQSKTGTRRVCNNERSLRVVGQAYGKSIAVSHNRDITKEDTCRPLRYEDSRGFTKLITHKFLGILSGKLSHILPRRPTNLASSISRDYLLLQKCEDYHLRHRNRRLFFMHLPWWELRFLGVHKMKKFIARITSISSHRAFILSTVRLSFS